MSTSRQERFSGKSTWLKIGSSVAKSLSSTEAVSYTHLEVYKRQQQHRIPRASAQQGARHMDAGRQAGKNRMRNGARLARFAVRLEIQRGHKARMSPFFHRFQRGARPLATPVGGPNEDRCV